MDSTSCSPLCLPVSPRAAWFPSVRGRHPASRSAFLSPSFTGSRPQRQPSRAVDSKECGAEPPWKTARAIRKGAALGARRCSPRCLRALRCIQVRGRCALSGECEPSMEFPAFQVRANRERRTLLNADLMRESPVRVRARFPSLPFSACSPLAVEPDRFPRLPSQVGGDEARTPASPPRLSLPRFLQGSGVSDFRTAFPPVRP